ncbi:MAG: bifunctional transcriptional activator/DNA repair enzyme AdaA [Anaerolineae bacterium]
MSASYDRVEAAIRFIDDNFRDQPDLDRIASEVGLSPYHFQRLFRQWAGISPKRFLEFVTVESAKRFLDESRSVLDATYEVGLSGPGRLHDHFVNLEAVTPGEFKEKGAGLEIRHGVHPTPFGSALMAGTDRGICAISFLQSGPADAELEDLRRTWPGADLVEDPEATRRLGDQIFNQKPDPARGIDLFVKGTNFQIQLWKALLEIPLGSVRSYGDIARAMGRPSSARAVGASLVRNPIAYVIPCHRVIRESGGFGDYRWGRTRKRAMIAWEASRFEREAETRRDPPETEAEPVLS